MDLSAVEPSLIEARGKYATVSSEYKRLMSSAQEQTQRACDLLRKALQSGCDVDGDWDGYLSAARGIADLLPGIYKMADEAKEQKDALYSSAWGKN